MEHKMDFTLVNTYFHISPEGAEHPVFEVPALSLLDRGILPDLLEQGGKMVQAIGPVLPASFLGTSFCNLIATTIIFTAQYNRLLDLTLENMSFQIEPHDDHAHLGYRINELRWTDVPEENREAFLLAHWNEYIPRVVTPAVEIIARSAGAKPDMIWQQFGGQIAMIRDYILEHETSEAMIPRYVGDFRILKELAADLFGRRRNPFIHTPRYVDNPYEPGAKYMLRSSCCMYDCREGGEKCYVCPKLTPAERETMREQIVTSMAKAQ